MNTEIFIKNYINIFETSDMLNIFDQIEDFNLKISTFDTQPSTLQTKQPKAPHIVKAPYKKKSNTVEKIEFKKLESNSILLIQQNLKFIKILSNII